jgi:hypothetical protein
MAEPKRRRRKKTEEAADGRKRPDVPVTKPVPNYSIEVRKDFVHNCVLGYLNRQQKIRVNGVNRKDMAEEAAKVRAALEEMAASSRNGA